MAHGPPGRAHHPGSQRAYGILDSAASPAGAQSPAYLGPPLAWGEQGDCCRAYPSCGLTHIICKCPHLSHLRTIVHRDLVLFTARQPSAQVARPMQHYIQRLFSHTELEQCGHLWLSHWSPPFGRPLVLNFRSSLYVKVKQRSYGSALASHRPTAPCGTATGRPSLRHCPPPRI